MILPEHVLEVEGLLKELKDERANILSLLTTENSKKIEGDEDEGKDDYIPDHKDYEKMWLSLYRAEKRKNNVQDNSWVLDFLDAVIAAKDLPKYVYQTNKQRKKLTSDIFAATQKLKNIYKDNNYNAPLISDNNDYFSHGFTSHNNSSKNSNISISEVLDFYASSLADDITYADRIRVDDDIESRIFIRRLGLRNSSVYGQPLNASVGMVSWAVFGRYYPAHSVHGIVNQDFKGYTAEYEDE